MGFQAFPRYLYIHISPFPYAKRSIRKSNQASKFPNRYQFHSIDPQSFISWLPVQQKNNGDKSSVENDVPISLCCRRSKWLQPLLNWISNQPARDWLLVIDELTDEAFTSLSATFIPVQSTEDLRESSLVGPQISIMMGQLYCHENFPLTLVSVGAENEPGNKGATKYCEMFPEAVVIDEDTLEVLEILSDAPLFMLYTKACDDVTLKIQNPEASYFFRTHSWRSDLPGSGFSQDPRVFRQGMSMTKTVFSVHQVLVENPRAVEILYLISVFHDGDVPMTLLFRDDDNVRTFHGAIRKLLNLSLMEISADENYVTCPMLVRKYIQDRLKEQNILELWRKKAIEVLIERFPHGDASHWRGCEALLPHVHEILAFEANNNAFQLNRANLLEKIASFHTDRGFYQQAYSEYDEAFKIYKAQYGEKHAMTFETARKRAGSLFYLGRYDAAYMVMLHNAIIQEEVLGEGHPDLLTNLNSLALVLQKQGKHKEAITMYGKAINANLRLHTEANVDTFIMKSNLAILLNETGDYVTAQMVHEEVLEGRRTLLGPSDPATIESMSALASVLKSQGRYIEAAEVNENALALAIPVLGEDHPTTLSIKNNLAISLERLGKYAESVELHQSILETRLAKERENHPDVISSRLNLGTVLEKLKQYGRAADELTEALASALDTLGAESPTTLRITNSLGLVRLRQGEFLLAEKMFRSSLEPTIKIYTENNMETLITKNNLAGALQRRGKLFEADELNRGNMATAFEVLGPRHPFTLRTRNNAAEVLRELAQLTDISEADRRQYLLEALNLHEYALTGREAALPPDHPDISISRHNLERVRQLVETLGHETLAL